MIAPIPVRTNTGREGEAMASIVELGGPPVPLS